MEPKKEPVLFIYGSNGTKYIAEKIDTEDRAIDIASSATFCHMSIGITIKSLREDFGFMARVRARDLVLYSHWPVKTKRYFEILETLND